jgi:hypothetical protein
MNLLEQVEELDSVQKILVDATFPTDATKMYKLYTAYGHLQPSVIRQDGGMLSPSLKIEFVDD